MERINFFGLVGPAQNVPLDLPLDANTCYVHALSENCGNVGLIRRNGACPPLFLSTIFIITRQRANDVALRMLCCPSHS